MPKPVKISAKQVLKEYSLPATKAPTSAASAGSQVAPKSPAGAGAHTASTTKPIARRLRGHRRPRARPRRARRPRLTGAAGSADLLRPSRPPPRRHSAAASAQSATVATPMVKERLFANPDRPASYSAGGDLQLKSASQQIDNFQNYFSDTLHLAKNQYTLQAAQGRGDRRSPARSWAGSAGRPGGRPRTCTS